MDSPVKVVVCHLLHSAQRLVTAVVFERTPPDGRAATHWKDQHHRHLHHHRHHWLRVRYASIVLLIVSFVSQYLTQNLLLQIYEFGESDKYLPQ